jgi:hypothetical protein
MKLEIGVVYDGFRFTLYDFRGDILFEETLNQEEPKETAEAIKQIVQRVSGNTVPVEIQEDY